MSDTQLYGNISVLTNFPNLKEFSCSLLSESFKGDISVFANKPDLNYINISQASGITGNISAFANKTSLKTLYVNYTQVSGSVNSLANNTNLIKLLVNNTSISYKPGILFFKIWDWYALWR